MRFRVLQETLGIAMVVMGIDYNGVGKHLHGVACCADVAIIRCRMESALLYA